MYTFIEGFLGKHVVSMKSNEIKFYESKVASLDEINLMGSIEEDDVNKVLNIPYGRDEYRLEYCIVVKDGDEEEGKQKIINKFIEVLEERKRNTEELIQLCKSQ